MPDLGAFLLPIRAVQMLFAIILLGITAGGESETPTSSAAKQTSTVFQSEY